MWGRRLWIGGAAARIKQKGGARLRLGVVGASSLCFVVVVVRSVSPVRVRGFRFGVVAVCGGSGAAAWAQ